jgi:hypothetical protein
MQSTDTVKGSRAEIEDDLKHWSEQKAKAVKDKNQDRINVCNKLLDKYLDELNSLPKGL